MNKLMTGLFIGTVAKAIQIEVINECLNCMVLSRSPLWGSGEAGKVSEFYCIGC